MTPPHTGITIIVNQEHHEVPANTTLAALLQNLDLPDSGIALAVNQTVIVADQWSHTVLQDNDNIQLFQAIAGG